LLAAPKPPPTKADVSYGPHPHQLLDIYTPPQGAGPFPVVLWFGGLWAPSKGTPDLNHFFPAHCAVIAVEGRVMKDAMDEKINPPVSVCLLDARRSLQFVRLHAAEWNLDPQRIAVGGGSQGALPALYLACAGEKADPKSADPVERVSTKVTCAAAWRSQPSIDPKRMQEWVPGVMWGAPAFGCSFPESLKRRDEFVPLINQWSPDALLNKETPPIFFENNWGLTKPETVKGGLYGAFAPVGSGLSEISPGARRHLLCEIPRSSFGKVRRYLGFSRAAVGDGGAEEAGRTKQIVYPMNEFAIITEYDCGRFSSDFPSATVFR